MKTAFCKQIDYTRDNFGNGSEVYYKRNNNNTWKEPGNVHGQDDIIIFKRQAQLFFHFSNKPKLRKWQKKPLILDLILACLMQIWAPKFFLASFTSTSS